MAGALDSVHALPLPIALLVRRARNAKSPKERHDTAYYAWESSVRLLVAAQGPSDPSSLALASVGHWVSAARLGEEALTDAALLDTFALLSEIGGGKKSRPKGISARKLMGSLPAYRNKLMGHGAVRGNDFYQESAKTLLTGLESAWQVGVFLPQDAELVYSEQVEVGADGKRRGRILKLHGLASSVTADGDAVPIPDAVLPQQVYLRRGDAYRSLHPWVLLEVSDQSENVLFFNALKRAPEYLDYSSGETRKGKALAESFPTMSADLKRMFESTPITAGAIEGGDLTSTPSSQSSHSRLRRFVRGALVAVLVVVAVWAVWFKWQQQRAAKLAVLQSQFVIVLAPYYAATESGRDEGEVMRQLLFDSFAKELEQEPAFLAESELNEALDRGESRGRVRVLVPTDCAAPRTARDARQFGTPLHADVVLWGSVIKLGAESIIEPKVTRMDVEDAGGGDEPGVQALRAGDSSGNALGLRMSKAQGTADLALAILATAFYGPRGDEDKAVELLGRVSPAQALCRRARSAAFREDPVAMRLYEQALEADPEAVCALRERGRLFLMAGSRVGSDGAQRYRVFCDQPRSDCLALADRDLRAALEVDPGDWRSLFHLTRVTTALERYDELVTQLQRLCELDVDEGYRSLPLVLGWLGREAEAEAAIDAAAARGGDICAEVLLEHGRYERVPQCFEDDANDGKRLLTSDARSTRQRRTQALVAAAIGRGDLATAKVLVRDAGRSDWSTWLKIAVRQLTGAESTVSTVEAQPIEPAEVVEWLGDIAMHEGRFDEARKRFAELDKPAWVATAYELEGNFEGAVEALESMGQDPYAYGRFVALKRYLLLTRLHRSDAESELQLAIDSRVREVTLDPHAGMRAGRPYGGSTDAVLDVIRGAVAEEDIDSFIGAHTSRAWWGVGFYQQLGSYYAVHGDRERAERYLQRALDTGMRQDFDWLLAKAELARL